MATPLGNAALNQTNLGARVVSRTISWQQLVMSAWGSEYYAPDHGSYEFSNGRKYDSTDTTNSGIYNSNLGTPSRTPS